jgi:hypothetical protein
LPFGQASHNLRYRVTSYQREPASSGSVSVILRFGVSATVRIVASLNNLVVVSVIPLRMPSSYPRYFNTLKMLL